MTESSGESKLNMNDSVDFEPTIVDLLATSTPKRTDSADKRSSRRSWFEKSSSIKYSIAVENNEKHVTRNRHSDVEMETLILTHFTNPPRIGFGTCKVGITKHRTLIIKNPHEYSQNVKVERYPYKKNFFVHSTEFSVEGESVYHLDISWSPESEGNVREMIQFSVDNAYRLQAFVFGSSQNPQKKKKPQGNGLLGRKVKRPLSVVYTQSLANIAKSYSPEKSKKVQNGGKNCKEDEEVKLKTSDKLPVNSESKPKAKNHRRSNTYNTADQGEVENGTVTLEKSQEGTSSRKENESDENKENKTTEGDNKENKTTEGDNKENKTTESDNKENKTTESDNKENKTTESDNKENKTTESDNKEDKTTESDSTISNVNEFDEHQHTTSKPVNTDVVCPDTFNVQANSPGENSNNTASSVPMGTATKMCVSPNTFLKDMNETVENISVHLDQSNACSPDNVLNESVPHDLMLCQLEFVKSKLKLKTSDSRSEKVTSQNPSSSMSMSESTDVRRITFLTSDKANNPFSVVPEGSSPRRTTYTVRRKHLPHKTITKPSPVKRKDEGERMKRKQEMDDNKQAQKRRANGSFTPKSVQRNYSRKSLNSTKYYGKSNLVLPTPERTAMINIPSSICLTPDILEESRTQKNMLSGRNPIDWDLLTPERILLEENKTESKPKTPLSHHYHNLVLPTPEQNLQRLGPLESRTEMRSFKQTFSHESRTITGTPSHVPESPLLNDITHVKSSTVTKEKPLVLTPCTDMAERKPLASLFSPPRHRNDTELDSPLTECSEGSFTCTPLPNSPGDLDQSRRSTHVIEKPRIIHSSHIERKRLFLPLDDEEMENKENIPVTVVPESGETFMDGMIYERSECELGMSAKVKYLDVAIEVEDCRTSATELTCSQNDSVTDQSSKSTTPSEEHANEDLLESSVMKDITSTIKNGKICSNEDSSSKPNDKKIPHKLITDSSVECIRQKQPTLDNGKVRKVSTSLDIRENTSKTLTATRTLEKSTRGQVHLKRKAEEAGIQQQKTTVPRKTVKPKTIGVAKSKLLLLKKPKTALPKHPIPFASKNIYYDERWMEKQERGFTQWLNFILTPSEDDGSSTKSKVDAAKLCLNKMGPNKLAPTKEALSFKEYSASRKLNGLRRAACKLFQSAEVVTVIQKVEVEVESQRLMIRKDRKVHADLGLKQSVLDLLLSFNPLWLRIGLETVFGEIISIHSNSDVIGLSHFIVTRLLGNPDIAIQYAHQSVPHLYTEGYSEAIGQHLLKKFLLVVYFLDYAKCAHLIKHDPCLFCRDSEYKSCKALMLEFSRHFLSGEGDINRHLGYLGYRTNHTQTALDEFDYAVQNLSTDLRDGLRLVRILDLLEEKVSLKRKLRVPAISRLQKIHNMEVAFTILNDIGIDMMKDAKKISCRDIVDGHREKTLHLLWTVILKYQHQQMLMAFRQCNDLLILRTFALLEIGMLLNENQLRDEIAVLERSLHVRNQLQDLRNYELGLEQNRRDSGCGDLYSSNQLVALVLKWCRVVCLYYGLKVENFTVSFGDGRAFCFLVHHYHPSLLPYNLISTRTTMSYLEEMEHQSLDCSLSDSPAPVSVSADQDVYKDLLKNERENFKVLHHKVSQLGGVPMMIRATDMCNTIPDEKVVLTYVSYLCARLLDIREEARAARTIQIAWRRHYLHKAKGKIKVRERAAIKIQRFVRGYLQKMQERKQEISAICIQKHARGYLARKKAQRLMEEKQLRAAKILKNCLLTHMERKRFVRMKTSAVKIQSIVRRFLVMKQIAREKAAARVIQNWYLTWKESKSLREEFLQKKQCIITIQRAVKKFSQSRKIMKEKAAVLLQKTWRGYCMRRRYQKMQSSAVVIQRMVRTRKQRREYTRRREAVLLLQQKYRAYLSAKKCRSAFNEVKSSCIVIQQAWRKYRNKCNHAAVTLQSHWRCFTAQRQYREQRKAVINLQALFRGFSVRKQYLNKRKAAVQIQKRMKEILEGRRKRKQFLALKAAATTIQATFRAYQDRKEFRRTLNATVVLQTTFRKYVARAKFKQTKRDIIKIQRKLRATWQMRQELKKFQDIKQAVLTIQSHFRGHKVRKVVSVIQQREAAAKIIQKTFRCHHSRKRYLKHKCSAVIIQRAYRSWKSRREVEQKCKAAVILQRVYRGLILMREHRRSFLQLRSACCFTQQTWRMKMLRRNQAAVTIQSHWRAHAAKKRFRETQRAVISLQAFYRMWKTRKNYLLKKKASVIIQKRYREYRKGRAQRKHFLITKWAALTIQALYRRHQIKKQFRRLRQSAILIQAVFKGSQVRREYLAKKKATLTIQRRFREIVEGRKQRCHFLLQKGAAITIQANFKAYLARQCFQKSHHAMIRLQASIRSYLQKKAYQNIRRKTCKIQRKWRATLAMKDTRHHYLIMKGAAITVQAFYRKYQAQKRYRQMQASTIKLQSFVRTCLVHKKFRKLKQSACIIQRQFRAYLEMRQTRQNYLIQKGAALTIQASFRGYLVCQEYRKTRSAVIRVQSIVRKFLCRRNYVRYRQTVLRVQRLFRQKMHAVKIRKDFLIAKGAAITIQDHYRRYLQQKECKLRKLAIVKLQSCIRMKLQRKLFQAKKTAASKIQKWFRNESQRRRAEKEYQMKRRSIVVLQSAFRGYKARKQAKCRKRSVIQIQAVVRKFLMMKQFWTLKKCAVFCQRRYRAKLQKRLDYQKYLARHKAAVTIQSWYRGRQVRMWRTRQEKCAQKIQSWYRSRKQLKSYTKVRGAALVCQRAYRNNRLSQSERRKFLTMKRSAIVIQAFYRGHKAKREYQRTMQATLQIQSACREFLAQKRKRRLHEAATVIQKAYRAHMYIRRVKQQEAERLSYLSRFTQAVKLHMAATVIQRRFRKYVSLCRAREQLHSVLIIQNWIRGRICRIKFLKLKRSVLVIEAAALQWLDIRHQKQRQQAATTIQAVWKGRQIRLKNKCKKIEVVRKRIMEAHRTATDDKKLGNRTESALDYLLKYKQLSQILEALVHLDVATRLSPACCERLVEVRAVSVFYTLISSCNRSQPHMEIIKLAVNILLNLAKYDKTRPYVFMEGTLDILLDLMQIYREKGVIFNRTCTLVGILARDDNRRMAMISQPRVIERIQSLHNLTARKYRLHENQQIQQAKLNASKIMNFTLPIRNTPRKPHRIRPEWVLHRESRHNIDNPMQAINFVMDGLHVRPK